MKIFLLIMMIAVSLFSYTSFLLGCKRGLLVIVLASNLYRRSYTTAGVFVHFTSFDVNIVKSDIIFFNVV